MKTLTQMIIEQEVSQLKALIEWAGTQKALSEKLGESTQTVSNWVARGRISATAALKVEELTNGEFKASEMRPDVKQWRGK